MLHNTNVFDAQTLRDYKIIAKKYLFGSDGFPLNEKLAAKLFKKIENLDNEAKIQLGFLYLEGRGVEKNYNQARKLF